MESLKSTGCYEITTEMKEKLKDFVGGYASEEDTKNTIHDIYHKTGYVMDTHTAVASHVAKIYRNISGDDRKMVIASTASPYKFAGNVMSAIDEKYNGMDEFALVDAMEEISDVKIPNAVHEIRNAKIRHTRECDIDKMEEVVKEILKVEV